MPKISSMPSARPSCAYNSLLHDSLQQPQIDAILAFLESQPVANGNDKDPYNIEQAVLWLNEAILRRKGYNTIEQPEIDHFKTRGRTIYNTQPINFDIPPPKARRSLVRRLSDVMERLDKGASEMPIFLTENVVTEAVTPRRRAREEPQSTKSSKKSMQSAESCFDEPASPSNMPRSTTRSDPDLQTLFLAIAKGTKRFVPERAITPTPVKLQKTEFTSGSPERCASIPHTPEKRRLGGGDEAWSRSSTPSLSWSASSVNSSPGSVGTMNWDEDWDCSGPEIISVEPTNYQPVGSDAAEYARLERFSYTKTDEAEGLDGSLREIFELFVNGMVSN